jgi:uncharacterized protein YgiM (DUF1202 family)
MANTQQDSHRQAVEEFEDARDYMRDQYAKMREDLRFSDPTDPQQWDKKALELRAGRPCLTFDRTNQFIAQVVNGGRQNKPSILTIPADSGADILVAQQLDGIVRHIEYISRAGIAYDTALEYAARIGLGWIRVIPEVMRPETNEQEIRIKRISDPLSCYLEAGWSEPDGSDAMVGFIESMMSAKAFRKQWPKAKDDSWEKGATSTGWFDDKQVRICERLKIVETKVNKLSIQFDGQQIVVGEDEYWQLRQATGIEIPAQAVELKRRDVKWSKMSGCEVLEETDFPSIYLPLIPVIGHELWVDGKRHLCGMTRRLMDSQRAYNYERSAFIESVAMQPKAPIMAPAEAMEGHEEAWARLNQGNPAVLPYNHVDENQDPIPAPTRLSPPQFPVAFAQGGQIASTDMESAVGMFRANLGAPGAATSGRAKREDKVAGDTANFHYQDNLSRSIEQLGRVIVDMIPRVYDTARQARIVGEDGEHSFVQVDPEMPQAVKKQGKKVVAINPGVGAYDVRVKTGPAYTTLREEQAEQLAHIMQSAPTMTPILADLWVAAQDFPDAQKAQKRLAAMLPPQIQQMENDDDEEIPPALQAHMMQLQQQLQECQQALQQAGQVIQGKQIEVQAQQQEGQQRAAIEAQKAQMEHDREMRRLTIDEYNAETARMKLHAEAQAVQQKHAVELSKEQMKGEHVAMTQDAKTQHIAIAEDAKANTAIEVARINADSRQDVAELQGLIQLLLAKMQPPQPLAIEVASDEAEEAQSETTGEAE